MEFEEFVAIDKKFSRANFSQQTLDMLQQFLTRKLTCFFSFSHVRSVTFVGIINAHVLVILTIKILYYTLGMEVVVTRSCHTLGSRPIAE